MRSKTTISFFFALFLLALHAECNSEGDALNAWRSQLSDPNNVLQSWDPTLVNPCTWFHITCNLENSVTRVDLGNAGLSGHLVPQLGLLSNLQYLYVNMNNLSGSIPSELGNLTRLINLSLSDNNLSGPIPSSLGNLRSLRFMNLNGNSFTGTIPHSVIQLVQSGSLQTLDVSDNQLLGTVRNANSSEYRITTIIQDPRAQR